MQEEENVGNKIWGKKSSEMVGRDNRVNLNELEIKKCQYTHILH